jgi:hypothetical protein
MNGMSLSDFDKVDEALAVADELIEQNKKEWGHSGEKIDAKNPLLVRFWYVNGEGRKRSWGQTEDKVLDGECDVKSKKQLLDSEVFLEALGNDTGASSSGGSTVKIENIVHGKMVTATNALKS